MMAITAITTETIKVAWAGGVSRNIVFPPSAKPVFGQSNFSSAAQAKKQNAWQKRGSLCSLSNTPVNQVSVPPVTLQPAYGK
jgi:hypothetical protein